MFAVSTNTCTEEQNILETVTGARSKASRVTKALPSGKFWETSGMARRQHLESRGELMESKSDE